MQNKVELLGYYGSDEVIACSAWTSTSRNLTDEKRNRIQPLINMLWINGHETPFEKGVVHFLVDTDIASHIHLLKHRISSLNAESARYKELKKINPTYQKTGPNTGRICLSTTQKRATDYITFVLKNLPNVWVEREQKSQHDSLRLITARFRLM